MLGICVCLSLGFPNKIRFYVYLNIDPNIYIYIHTYYKELVHAIMEAERPQDLQSASQRPKKADGIKF